MTANEPTVEGDRPAAKSFAGPWATRLAILSALIVALGALSWHSVVAAVEVWWVSPTFSHCFLIIPVSAYLIWLKRDVLARLAPVTYPKALWLAIPVVLAALVGSLTAINEIKQLALIAFVQVLILALLGWRIYRVILFPSLFLFFLVPMGEYLIGPLQRFTTRFISDGLDMLGILHYTEGNTIQLANGIYEVAEACAGLRFLIATIAVGAVFAYFTYRKWYKVAIYIVACMVVPVIANGFRALGIVLLAHYSDNRIATGTDHLVYGWGFSVVILAVLMVIGMRFADPEVSAAPVVADGSPRKGSLVLTVAVSIVAIAIVPVFLFWRAHAAPAIDRVAFAVPPAPSGWTISRSIGEWRPLYGEPDAKLAFSMRQTGGYAPEVDVIAYYYTGNGDGAGLITSTNKLWDEEVWHPVVQDDISGNWGGESIPMRELEISGAGVSRLIWWTYASGGRFTTSAMTVKLNRLRLQSLGGEGASLVTVSTPIDSDIDAARARLRKALAVLGNLRERFGERR